MGSGLIHLQSGRVRARKVRRPAPRQCDALLVNGELWLWFLQLNGDFHVRLFHIKVVTPRSKTLGNHLNAHISVWNAVSTRFAVLMGLQFQTVLLQLAFLI